MSQFLTLAVPFYNEKDAAQLFADMILPVNDVTIFTVPSA
jgi:hypothetical protein